MDTGMAGMYVAKWNTALDARISSAAIPHVLAMVRGWQANAKDQRLAAHEPAITHDDARESFASCG